jgi:exosortase/archaeosortase
MKSKEAIALFARYLLLILIALPGFSLFYWLFTPLTEYPAKWILELFYPTEWTASIILIPACIAGGAYYLLLILNLATPMQAGTRAKSIIFLILAFLALNIARIVLFSVLYFEGAGYFSIAHKYTWLFGSTILVVLIWFASVRLFKIRAIPAYTDLLSLFAEAKRKRAKKK